MKWLSRLAGLSSAPKFGTTIHDDDNYDYPDYSSDPDYGYEQPKKKLSYYEKQMLVTYHPRWQDVYTHEFNQACQQFYNSRGYWPQQTYNYVLGAVESEARSRAEAVIMALMDNDGSY